MAKKFLDYDGLDEVVTQIKSLLLDKQDVLTAGQNITIETINNALTISASGTTKLTDDTIQIYNLDAGVYSWELSQNGTLNCGNKTHSFGNGSKVIITVTDTKIDGQSSSYKTFSATYGNALFLGYATSASSGEMTAYVTDKILTKYLSGSASWDTTPTNNSTKPVTSGGIYTELSNKQGTITGGATTITTDNLTASRALVSNSSGKVAVSDVTSTELGYLDGVTSAIQTQINGKQATLDSTQLSAVNSGINSTLVGKITTNESAISTINGKIPSQASTTNQLADKDFVNSSIQTQTAHFRGNWDTWSAVPTSASSYPADDDGNTTPTSNDYMVVQDASGYPVGSGEDALVGTWRFKYSGVWATNGRNGWLPEYQVNETPLTSAQLNALNSGITSSLVTQIGTNQTNIGNKVDKSSTASQVYITNSGGTSTTASQGTAFNKNFETSTTNIKMNGSVSVGSSSNIARADHVHPTDTSRLPTYATDSTAYDTTPTSSSTKPITSGGVYTALAGKEDTMTAITTQEIDDLFNGNS